MLSTSAYESAVAVAVRAPSVHNTQPWRFRRDGDRIELRADRTRWLPAEDPQGRELLLSCGGALRHLVLGLRSHGLDTCCDLLPDPDDQDLLAVVTVIGSRSLTLPEMHLFAAVWTRHTDRSAFSGEPVPEAVLDQLSSVVEAEGCHFDVLTDDGVLLLAVLGSRAERALERDPVLADEQQRWTSDVLLPREGVPVTDDRTRGSDVPLRRFAADLSVVPVPDPEPPVPESPVLGVLSSDQDRPVDWIEAGWALSDLLLAVESHGLSASPLTQVLELPALREQLTGALRLQGHPQVVLRIGVPTDGAPGRVTERRPVSEVLT